MDKVGVKVADNINVSFLFQLTTSEKRNSFRIKHSRQFRKMFENERRRRLGPSRGGDRA